MQKNVAILALCVAVLTLLPKTAFAIAFTNRSGHVIERDSISGVVVHVDNDQRSFTLRWVRIVKMTWAAYDTQSNQDTYRISEEIVYKNGSWAYMGKGKGRKSAYQRTRICGRVDRIQVMGRVP
jgi:hypothetical protein